VLLVVGIIRISPVLS